MSSAASSNCECIEICFLDEEEEKEDTNEENKYKTWTITFSESVENHVGMQKIGTILKNGLSISDIDNIYLKFKDELKCELIDIEEKLDPKLRNENTKAKILIIRGLAKHFLGNKFKDLVEEVKSTEKIVDKKAFMKGRVVNKLARYNLCYGNEDQEPDYENKKGRILSFKSTPFLSVIREKLSELNVNFKDLLAELNYYYDTRKCGIGFHGDSERRLVIGTRFGSSMNLQYQWFFKGENIGDRLEVILNEGDIYFMSEKAVGTDWKRKIIPTLRHAAGSKKYTTIK